MTNLQNHPEFYNPNHNFPSERWKEIDGINDYLISNLGRVKRISRIVTEHNGKRKHMKDKVMRCRVAQIGYRIVQLTINYKNKVRYIHRLVAIAFIPNPQNKGEVNHINGIKTDNRLCNLEWVTRGENVRHSVDTLNNSTTARPVIQSLDGREVGRWDSLNQASDSLGYNISLIHACCNGIKDSYKGYNWMYG